MTLFAPPPPLPCLTFIKVVTLLSLQSESECAPGKEMKKKSTGIKFQCNCLLNCGLQLLKFYPWSCVTTAVMNSVWLWCSHWRHAHFALEKKMGGRVRSGTRSGAGGAGMKRPSRETRRSNAEIGELADTPFLLNDQPTLVRLFTITVLLLKTWVNTVCSSEPHTVYFQNRDIWYLYAHF